MSAPAQPFRRETDRIARLFCAICLALFVAAAAGSALAAPIDPADAPDWLGLKVYEVAEGDTLLGMAERFGITANTIVWANDLGNKEFLKIGQKLIIPPVSGVLHKVEKGDTILGIAQAYGVEASTVAEANRLSDSSLIREGQVMLVPYGVKKTPPSGPSPGEQASAGTIEYTVEPGDTLVSIAAAFGVRVSAILAANSMSDPDFLKVGQLLLIPGGQPPPAPPPEPQQGTPSPAGGQETRSASPRGDEGDGRSFIATVTAYCLPGRTHNGTPVQWGVVAVDPNVIPLGSKIQIDGFGEVFSAEDTGSGIKGRWVDIWFDNCSDARRFGTQSRRVTILEP